MEKVTEVTMLVDLYKSVCKLYYHAEDERDVNFYSDILKFCSAQARELNG